MRFSSDEVMPVPLDPIVCKIGDALLSAMINAKNANTWRETAAGSEGVWVGMMGWWWDAAGVVDRVRRFYHSTVGRQPRHPLISMAGRGWRRSGPEFPPIPLADHDDKVGDCLCSWSRRRLGASGVFVAGGWRLPLNSAMLGYSYRPVKSIAIEC